MIKKTPTGKQLRAEQRRSQVIDAISDGQTVAQIAEQQGVSPKTITRDKMKLMKTIQGNNQSEMEVYRDEQLAELSELKAALSGNEIKPDRKVELALAIIDRQMKLLGTAAPSRRMSLSLNASMNMGRINDPNANLGDLTDDELMFRVGKEICVGHTQEQVQEICNFANSLPRQTMEEAIKAEIAKNEAEFYDKYVQPLPGKKDGNDE